MINRNFKILVVDDDAVIGRVLKAGLERHGFTVRYEGCSSDTIKTCLEFHPDLVLLDVDMPVKDGGQVVTELQNHATLRHTPVMFLTALARKEEAAKWNADGQTLLSKQISIKELVQICNHLLKNVITTN